MCIKKYNLLIFFYIIFTVFISCTSTQSSTTTKKDSIPVILDVSDNIKLAAFEFSVFTYFRRYPTTQKDDGTFYVKYGRYPVIVSYDNGRIYVESSLPEKHPIWLYQIHKLMKKRVIVFRK